METTTKTSGEQIKMMLTMLFGEKKAKEFKVTYDNDNIGFRIEELIPSLGEIIEVLNICNIDPMFIGIDNMWGHLTLWVCNYDNSDINF